MLTGLSVRFSPSHVTTIAILKFKLVILFNSGHTERLRFVYALSNHLHYLTTSILFSKLRHQNLRQSPSLRVISETRRIYWPIKDIFIRLASLWAASVITSLAHHVGPVTLNETRFSKKAL